MVPMEQQLSEHQTGERVKEIQIVESKKEIAAESKEKRETGNQFIVFSLVYRF